MSYRTWIWALLNIAIVLVLLNYFTNYYSNQGQNAETLSESLRQRYLKPPLHRRLYNIPDSIPSITIHHIQFYDLSQPVLPNGTFDCVTSKTKPNFPICVYEPYEDKFISAALRTGGIWEPDITKTYQKAINKYPEALIIDIGSNIGYYTLLSVKLGHRVIAVEPYYENILRFHKGLYLSKLTDKVQLSINALSDCHENVTFNLNAENQGGISVRPLDAADNMLIQKGHKLDVTTTITMDDLLLVTDASTAIIKLDIEGYECKAMGKASNFLDNIYVPYIFMEWRQMFTFMRRQNTACPPKAMQKLALILNQKGYTAYEVRTHVPMNPTRSTKVWRVGDVYWKHQTAKPLNNT